MGCHKLTKGTPNNANLTTVEATVRLITTSQTN